MIIGWNREQNTVTIPIYLLLVGIMATVLSPVFSIYTSVRVAQNNAEKQRQAQIVAEQKAQEQSRIIACALFAAILDTYDETPPTTQAGRNVQATWLRLYRISSCKPSR